MTYTELSVQDRIIRAKEALNNALSHGELGTYLAEVSYTSEKLQTGLQLQVKASGAQEVQILEYGEAVQVQSDFLSLWNSLRNEVRIIRGIARVVLKDHPMFHDILLLNVTFKQTQSGSMDQIETMLNNADAKPEVFGLLTPYNITPERFAALRETFNTLNSLMTSKSIEKSEAQQATRDRDAAVDALDEWMVDFLQIAQFTCEDKPELLELLGIVVPS